MFLDLPMSKRRLVRNLDPKPPRLQLLNPKPNRRQDAEEAVEVSKVGVAGAGAARREVVVELVAGEEVQQLH